jgi:hypothetical protein
MISIKMVESNEEEEDEKERVVDSKKRIGDDRKKKLEAQQMKIATGDILEENWGQPKKKDDAQKVIVTDIHMPFWSMVTFMVRWAVASVPAFIILVFITIFVMGFLRGCLP